MRALSILLVLFCLSPGLTAQTLSTPLRTDPELAVVVMSLRFGNTESGYDITLTNAAVISTAKAWTEASLDNLEEGDFICHVKDAQSRTLHTLAIQNPFLITLEYPSEGNTLATTQKEVVVNDVILRFPVQSGMQYLEISQNTVQRKLDMPARITLPDFKQ